MRPGNRRQRLGSHLFGPPIDRQLVVVIPARRATKIDPSRAIQAP